MSEKTLSSAQARRLYDWLGARYDWFAAFEAQAKNRLFEHLDLQPGLRLLNVGLGAGRDQQRLQTALAPGGAAFGVDLSLAMLRSARHKSGAPLCQADGERLPFAPASFDRLCCLYVLDLIAAGQIPAWLDGFRRLLRPGGRLALVSLTEGIDRPSRALVGAWKRAYALSPLACAGCRPLQLAGLVRQAGFTGVESEIIVQLGVPSEIVTALAPGPSPRDEQRQRSPDAPDWTI